MTERERIIQNYIDGYNQFNIDQMVADFHEEIIFENIQNDEITMSLTGLEAFRQQAEQATTYFLARTQTVRSFRHSGNRSEVEIDYNATLAMDLPNGLKKGQELKLSGKSVFVFRDDRIIKLTDIS